MSEPVVDVNLLIRRPPAEAYEAFADPGSISKFWLGSSSGRLETGAEVHWVFKIAGAETDVRVLAAEPGRLLDLRWDGDQPVRFTFEPHDAGTLVGVRVTGFGGADGPATAVETMSGFTLVLASLKMWLEHGIEGDLMYDKFPDADYSDR